ncbi:MAG: hypothetical protein DRJ57_01570 [Thermoprotei archaeon]|nr:MAG: hypothetical protein DRJ57_01570 [Thermoprotei archaeon]
MGLPAVIYKLKPEDNVGTALSDLVEGRRYPVFEEGSGVIGEIEVITPVPKWYKVSLERIGEDEEVVKFGYTIGVSVMEIEPGVVVHVTNVVLDSKYEFKELVKGGFILGEALVRIEKGELLRVGRNFRPLHPSMKELPPRSRVGVAAAPIAEGGAIRLGNIVDVRRELGWNERYRRLVRDFYRFLRAGLMEFSRIQVG